MKAKKISKQLLKRLSIYLDYLKALPDSVVHISATTIARALGLGDVQVRKDLTRVSTSGQCRTGHVRAQLIRDIEDFMDYATSTGAVIIGTGKLGQALMDYPDFEKSGLNILAGFDIQPPAAAGRGGKPIYHAEQLEAFCGENNVQIGIIAVPADQAQQVCDRLVKLGICAIWNFAPVTLSVPQHVLVQAENLAVSATTLRILLCSGDGAGQSNS